MDRAKIALIEDREEVRHLAKTVFEVTSSHKVVAEATTRNEAMELVGQVALGVIAVDVFLLDGDLSTQSGHGEDASIISDFIRRKKLSGYIVGFSNHKNLNPDMFDHTIEGKDIFSAVNLIDDLPELD